MANARKALDRKFSSQRRLGEILVEEGYISRADLDTALHEQKTSGGLIGEVMTSMGLVTEWEVAKCLVAQFQLPFMYTSTYDIAGDVLNLLPHAFLHQHRLVPLDLFGKVLLMATSGDLSVEIIEEIEESTGLEVSLFIALNSDLQNTLQDKFPLEKITDALADRFDQLFES